MSNQDTDLFEKTGSWPPSPPVGRRRAFNRPWTPATAQILPFFKEKSNLPVSVSRARKFQLSSCRSKFSLVFCITRRKILRRKSATSQEDDRRFWQDPGNSDHLNWLSPNGISHPKIEGDQCDRKGDDENWLRFPEQTGEDGHLSHYLDPSSPF